MEYARIKSDEGRYRKMLIMMRTDGGGCERVSVEEAQIVMRGE